jgi:hypothetical protein
MFDKLKELWENKGWEILIAFCISFIIIYGLYRIITRKKGSWSNTYSTYNVKDINNISSSTNKKVPPKESKGEIECKRVLEKIFNKPFNKSRPDFLNNPVTGGNHNLELDCYNKELRLAVEYNGKQHYEYTPYFHRNKEHFLNQKYRDDMKRRMCRDHNIVLIEVPYTVKIENIENFLLTELNKY